MGECRLAMLLALEQPLWLEQSAVCWQLAH